ncbi:hypothetical protein NJB1604_00150 [Mycobacterium marinum]|uniref:hypothetical protein n=1 Tax=Mycobacterium marinum TaxID=1781 RepID=UPI0021C329B6|nr:hypothetical protein [Mycobacterium marinum]GJO36593.1 hypothetical protein NJB1604_00150 [Mycobacterium marinum]
MSASDTVRHLSARTAALSRSRPADDPEYVAVRRDLAAAQIADHIRRVVAQAPPFSAAQVAQLRVLLEPARAELSRETAVADRLAELGGDAA